MKFGIKLWSNQPQPLEKAVQLIEDGIFDYIELYIVPESTIDPFKNTPANIPINIHAPHGEHGTNIGDHTAYNQTSKNIKQSIRWATKLSSEYIILHSGYGSMECAINFLHNFECPGTRFVIENMPLLGLNGEQMIGYSPKHIEKLLSEKTCVDKICLDFGHAIKAAYSIGIPYKEYLQLFTQFKPQIFHVSDGLINKEMDSHMSIGNGNYDMKFIADYIINYGVFESKVTLETPSYGDTIGNAVKNLNTFKEYLNVE